MTPERQQLVQDTWHALEPNAPHLIAQAIRHLIEIAPDYRPLLDGAATASHAGDIAGIIGDLVGALDEPKRFVPLAVRLGRDTADCGVDARLYSAAGEALIWALQQHLGSSFSPEIQKAWIEGHRLTAAIMQRAAQARTGEFERFRTGEFEAFQNTLTPDGGVIPSER
jgi:nitric oxide dioxygenase